MKDLLRTISLAVAVAAVPAVATLVANQAVANTIVTNGNSHSATTVADRAHVVYLNQDGTIAGRVVAIDAVSKSQSPLSSVDVFFVQNGAVIKRALTDDDGQFAVDGVLAGTYSFVAASAKGFAAYGLVVKPFETGAAANTILAPTVSPRFHAVRSVAEKYLPDEAAETLGATEIPTGLVDLDLPTAGNRIRLHGSEIRGTLGSLVSGQSLGGMHVALVQQDSIVAETTADAEGKFTFTEVSPGAYDFVAAGTGGFAAIGFEAVQEPNPASVLSSVPQEDAAKAAVVEEVKKQDGVEEVLDVVVTPAGDTKTVSDQLQAACDACGGEVIVSDSFTFDGMPIEQCGGAVGCGACAGSYGCGCDTGYYGGGGGGGGYGMYGPLANLAQLALAGWIIAELVDNNNDNNVQPVSPNN